MSLLSLTDHKFMGPTTKKRKVSATGGLILDYYGSSHSLGAPSNPPSFLRRSQNHTAGLRIPPESLAFSLVTIEE